MTIGGEELAGGAVELAEALDMLLGGAPATVRKVLDEVTGTIGVEVMLAVALGKVGNTDEELMMGGDSVLSVTVDVRER